MRKVYRKSRRRRTPRGNFFYTLSMAVLCLFLLIGATAVISAYSSRSIPQPQSNQPPASASSQAAPQVSRKEEQSEPEPPSQEATPSRLAQSNSGPSSKPEEGSDVSEEPAISVASASSQPQEQENRGKQNDFSDAVFLGDSRTEGLSLYGGLKEATFFTQKGMTVGSIYTKPAIATSAGKLTVMQALEQKTFDQVFIMLGVNELGYVYSDIFISRYEKIIDGIRAINPRAKIYVQAILPVTKGRSQKDTVFNNNRIREYNDLLREMSERKEVKFLETDQAVADANGCLPDEASTDGVHLTAEYYKKWGDYLRNCPL